AGDSVAPAQPATERAAFQVGTNCSMRPRAAGVPVHGSAGPTYPRPSGLQRVGYSPQVSAISAYGARRTDVFAGWMPERAVVIPRTYPRIRDVKCRVERFSSKRRALRREGAIGLANESARSSPTGPGRQSVPRRGALTFR